jgi:SAM-dependent methyltransferase
MASSRIIVANCYDYPQYYDVALPAYTKREADFIEAACRKYCLFEARRLLEPACGGGRLITELTARGYEVAGFDLSRPALNYLRRRLARLRLHAETFEAGGRQQQRSRCRCDSLPEAARCCEGVANRAAEDPQQNSRRRCGASTGLPCGGRNRASSGWPLPYHTPAKVPV